MYKKNNIEVFLTPFFFLYTAINPIRKKPIRMLEIRTYIPYIFNVQ